MSFYLILNFSIIIIPLLFSFEEKIKFYKKVPVVLLSILIVSPFYILWDIAATYLGDWSFNKSYVGNIFVFNLPLEEILFFITVPYSIIFLYETVKFYIKGKDYPFNKVLYFLIALLLTLNSYFFNHNNYTGVVLLISGFFFLISLLFYPDILTSKNFWITILISFIPFLIVNYLLTSLPVLQYNENEIWGIRMLTIPLEDFFYSFSMIAFWLMVYDYFRSKYYFK